MYGMQQINPLVCKHEFFSAQASIKQQDDSNQIARTHIETEPNQIARYIAAINITKLCPT
jgi:hypothetical protein